RPSRGRGPGAPTHQQRSIDRERPFCRGLRPLEELTMSAEEQAQAEQASAAASEITSDGSGLLESILDQGLKARDDHAREWGRDLLKEFISQLLDPSMVVAKDTEKTINLRIAEIDRLLSAQLNEIMHHPDFQQLEASWRGLHYLVHQSETSTMLKIRVLNVSKKDLLKDL